MTAFGDFMEGAYLAHAVYGYFLNGGGAALRGAHRRRRARGHGACRDRHRRRTPSCNGYRISALESGPGGNQITVEVTRGDDRRRGHLQADGQRPGPARGGLRRRVHQAWQEQRRDRWSRSSRSSSPIEEVGQAGASSAIPAARPGHPGGRRERQADAPDARTTTSATPPTGPASAASRRSTRSRCSPSPT